MSIMDINELIIDEQWKRTGGDGSEWEQKLVKHKAELQQGLTEVKGRLENSNDEDEMAMDATTIPTIVMQEPDTEADRKLADAFNDNADSLPQQESEVSNPPQSPAISSPLREMTGDFDSSISSSTLIDLETKPQAASLIPPSPHLADTTQEFAILFRDLLDPGADDEQPTSTCIEIELRTKGGAAIEVTSVEQSASTIDPNTNICNTASNTQLLAPATTEFTVANCTRKSSGHKRGSDEAGLDEQGTSEQVVAGKEGGNGEPPAKRRNHTSDREGSDATPSHTLPKTPAKGKTPRTKPKATPLALRRSTRKH
jgi:hypothetical protein